MPDETPRPEVMFAVVAVLTFTVIRLVRWIRQAAPQPDPWDKEVEDAVQAEDAVPLCPHCLAPQEPETWFCAECGCSVGRYNNVNPYLFAFSLGDLFRNGTAGRICPRPLVITGFLLLSLWAYLVFWRIYFTAIPTLLVALTYWGVFWFLFLRNPRRPSAGSEEVGPPTPAT